MNNYLLIHAIAHDNNLKRLIVCWPFFKKKNPKNNDLEEWINFTFQEVNSLNKGRYLKSCQFLLDMGICALDGTIEETVEKFLNKEVYQMYESKSIKRIKK